MPSDHKFVVDISRHIGEAQSLVSAVLRQMQAFPGSIAIWYIAADQVLPHGFSVLPRKEGEQPATIISAYIAQTSTIESVFHVLSYDPFVLKTASTMNSDSVLIVATHIRAFAFPQAKAISRPLNTESNQNSVNSGSLSPGEGVELAKQVLRSGNHTSETNPLLQSRLRYAMGPKARKNPLDQLSSFLIKDIVQDGTTKGWLKQKGPSGSEVIWLAGEIPGTVPPRPQQSAETFRVTQEPGKDVFSPKPPTRASQMEACLRARGIGSPTAVRPLFFDAIQDVMSKKGVTPLSAALLMRQSREQVAKHWIPSESGKKTPNWEAISVCILNMLLCSGVLLNDENNPLNAEIGGQSGNVVKLHPEFRDKSEAYLVFHIIKKMGDVLTSDKTNIGLALYQRGEGKDRVPVEDLIGRVDALLTMLLRTGKVEVEDDCIKAI